MTLSVVIVNYKVPFYLHQCLLSLEKATDKIETEFFVVDNDSGDGSVEFLRKYHPKAVFIENDRNLGFSKANNKAISRVKGDFVLLINPDTIVSEDTICKCLDFMSEHKEAGALGVSQHYAYGMFAPESRRAVPKPMTALFKFTGLCKRFPKNKVMGRYYLGFLDRNEKAEIEVLSGAFMFIRHQAIKEVGAFDEDYFMYGEDIDLSYRILKGGYKNYYLPTRILHYKGESTHKQTFTYVNNFNKSMTIFFKKHFKAYSWFLELPILAAVYLKTVWGFVKVTAQKMFLKKVSDEQLIASYKFLVLAEDIHESKAAQLLRNNGYQPKVVPVTEQIKTTGHTGLSDTDWTNYDFVVYDTKEFAYKQMIDAFVRQYEMRNCNRPSLAVYHHDTNAIVTFSYVVQDQVGDGVNTKTID